MGRYKTHEVHKYPEESLTKALKEIRENGLGIREASRTYGVPRGTIQDRLHGRIKEGPRKMGPNTIFNKEEENELEKWLINLAKCGFPQKKNDLLTTVQKITTDEKRKTPFRENRPGEKWYQGFLKRHPNLSLREAEGLTKARSIITRELIQKWFRDLKQYLEENGAVDVLEDPTRIFNGDETSFAMCPKSGKVLAPKGYKNIYEIKKGSEKETITVLLVFSADGQIVSPMVVFPFVRPNKVIIDSIPADWLLGRSESGWMKSETFYEYIANGMDKWLTKNNIKRPVLLLVDGHKSHLSLELSKFCYDHQIILYALPPNTTHIMQPADVSVFKPLKTNWKKTVRQWQAEPQNVNSVLTKCTFCPLLQSILNDDSLPQTIQNGFRKCGLYPFNPEAVDYTKCIQNLLEKQQQPQENIIISEDQLETATVVLNHLKDKLTEKGISNIHEILRELQPIKQDFHINIDMTTTTDIETHDDMTTTTEIETRNDMATNTTTETYEVLPDGFLQIAVNNIPVTLDSELEPSDRQNLNTLSTTIEETKTEHENEKVILINKSNIMDNEKEILNDFDFNDNDKADKEITVSNPKDLIIEIKLSNESVIDVDKCNSSEKTSAENGMNHEKDEQKEIQLQLSLEDKKNGPLQVKQNKINILQNVKIRNAGGGTVSPFQNHLFFPSPIASSQKRQQKDPLPSAISAIEYRKILQQKIDLKEKAENEKLKRKQERIRKKEDREVIPKKKQKKMYAKKLKQCNRIESESDDNTKVNLTSNIPSSSKKKSIVQAVT